MPDINIEAARKSWESAPDEHIARAINNIDDYNSSVKDIIIEEAERRQAENPHQQPYVEQTKSQKILSSVGLELDYEPEQTKDLGSAEKLIYLASGTAVFLASVTLIFSIISFFTGRILGVGPLSIIDATIAFTLAYGIYKKSRTCAVIIFLYWIVSIETKLSI